MNFSQAPQTIHLPNGNNGYQKIFDSADPQWHGPKSAPDHAHGSVEVQPESIIIYQPL
jgi:maltooligosyltrehalose trehalohydrolase